MDNMQWSVHFQNPEFLERSRFHMIQPEMEPLVRKWCHVKPDSRVLDIGCGTGYFTRLLAKEGAQVTGLDIEQPFIEYAVRQNEKDDLRVSYVQGDALDLPFEDESFDVVASHAFLTMIPDPVRAVFEMLRVLRPGGLLASVTPMSFMPEAADPGAYPPECTWVEEFSFLYRELYIVYDRIVPMAGYVRGVHPAYIPRFLADQGLLQVSAYPLGKLFSLSNAALTEDEKRFWIDHFEESEIKKLDVFMEIPEMKKHFSVEQAERFRTLLTEKCTWLRDHLQENSVWEWSGGANLLATGIKPDLFNSVRPL